MAYSSIRYLEYLNSYHFYPNSINFRIVSSKALEKFKNVQSFQLNQLVNGKFYFSQDKREILLIKYDMWSRWLAEIENFFIERHEKSKKITKKDHDIITALAEKTANTYIETMKSNTEHFDSDFTNIWIEIHDSELKMFIKELKTMQGSYEHVFQRIVNMLCEISQYTLTEIHELTEIITADSKTAFLVVSNYSINTFNKLNTCVTSNRYNIYKKYFNIDKIWLKNYTNSKIPKGVIQNLEKAGAKIDYKMCISE